MEHRWAILLALASVRLGSGAEPYALTGVVVDEAGLPVAGVEV